MQSTAAPYLVKIGKTSRPTKRVESLVHGSPVPLRTIFFFAGSQLAEDLLHFAFADQRAHGEWFHPHANLKTLVRAWKGADMRLLTPNVADVTIPRVATTTRQECHPLMTLQDMLQYYRESFAVNGLDGDGKTSSTPFPKFLLAFMSHRDVDFE